MKAEDVKWIVNSAGELGVEIEGQCFFLYKGESIEYVNDPLLDEPLLYRPVGKREFGEVCTPLAWLVAGRSEDRYTVDLADAGPDQWQPLPPLRN